ncbi:Glyoxalase/Bleomycin resistance protein/Dihydroxybiphenyl dioxygenase, partial [Amniculicola lignicola CBS 123094]
GTDCAADPATTGYFVNHIALLVNDIEVSRKWYSEVLGMRHAFTFDISEDFTLMYMGHSQAGRNGMGFQTGAEMVRDKNNMAGMVEFQWNKKQKEERKFDANPRNTVSHLGLIVPDLIAAQERFISLNVTIIKRAGELDWSPETGNRIFAGAWGFNNLEDPEAQESIRKAMPGIDAIGFKDFILIADPDGNLFEVQ